MYVFSSSDVTVLFPLTRLLRHRQGLSAAWRYVIKIWLVLKVGFLARAQEQENSTISLGFL